MPLFSQEALPSTTPDGTYTLVVPVELPPGATIDGDAEGAIHGRHVWLRRRGDRQLQVIVRGFESEEEARAGFAEVEAWLAWASCELKHGLQWSAEVPVRWFDEPPPDGELLGGATGFADHGTVIHPTGKRVALMSVGPARVVLGVPSARLLDAMTQAAALDVSGLSDRVRVGVDLYGAASWEASNYAKFLTLVNVLEVLKEQPDRGKGVQELVDKWIVDLANAEAAGTVAGAEAQSLRTSLRHLRRRGIRASIRALVQETLGDAGRASEAATMYDERSSLVHDGVTPSALPDKVARLDETVSLLLRALLRPRSSTT